MRSIGIFNVLFALGSIGCKHIEPGHVGIEVISCGSNSGVNPKPVGVGYHMLGACTSFIEYPIYIQNVVWTLNSNEGSPKNEEITFKNADKMSISADISLAYQLDADKAPAFYSQFKQADLEKFSDTFMHNMAREKFDEAGGQYKIDQIMGDSSKFLAQVRENLQKELDPYGIKIKQFGFIGAPRPPQAVIEAINATTHATQFALQIQNELAQSTAQAKKVVAVAEGEAQAAVARAKGEAEARRITADSEAYNNKALALSLSPVLVEYLKAKKWDGQLPQVQSNGSGVGTFVNLK